MTAFSVACLRSNYSFLSTGEQKSKRKKALYNLLITLGSGETIKADNLENQINLGLGMDEEI